MRSELTADSLHTSRYDKGECAMTEKETGKQPEAEKEVFEPGGRRQQRVEDMKSEALAAAYGDAARLRAHELAYTLDATLGNWMHEARATLGKRGHLEMIREYLPVYFDPSRKDPVFGPGGKLASQTAIERAIVPGKPLRQITGG
jgi:hypothetical protein